MIEPSLLYLEKEVTGLVSMNTIAERDSACVIMQAGNYWVKTSPTNRTTELIFQGLELSF